MRGQRIPDGEWFEGERKPGDYGKIVLGDGRTQWFTWPPGVADYGHLRHFDPEHPENAFHEVEEHEDGTISVRPSVLHRGRTLKGGLGPSISTSDWHGYLVRGYWRLNEGSP